MKKAKVELDWPALTAAQPDAGDIPDSLRQHAQQVDVKAREVLFRISDPISKMFLVVTGEVRLIRVAKNGSEVVLQRSRGGFVAEASLDARAYHCDAVVVEAGSLLIFPVAAFRAALENESAFRKAWQSRLAREVRKLRAQCERLSLHSAADRISHYIESEGTDGVVTLSQSRKAWAAELGLTHEALYRALRRMQDAGLLEVEGNRLTGI